jgi:hypothetical protein
MGVERLAHGEVRAMASYGTDEPLWDFEGWPVGHYRGKGYRQDRTGPSGPWLPGTRAGEMTAPAPRRAGRGPRGWSRSDERIREDVCEMLTEHGDIDPSDVEVEVSDRDVVLRGTVRSRWAKWYIEDLVLAVGGVRDVVNEIKIARGPSGDERGGPTSEGY